MERPRRNPPLSPDFRDFVRELRSEGENAESLMWELARNRRLAGFKFRRQHPMPPHVLQFYCVELNLAIELQDENLADSPSDLYRDDLLRRQGVQILRFSPKEVLHYTDRVVNHILRVVKLRVRA